MSERGLMRFASVAILLAIASPARAEAPADFVADARLFHRVVACGGAEPLPTGVDAKLVDRHCAEMARRYTRFRARYLEPAQAFFATHRPAGLPTQVVYPFGGGDLAGALVTYPEAREITTISLEHAGDPTRLAKLTRAQLRTALTEFRAASLGLLTLNDSTSENMRKLERGGIPGQLSFHLLGMTAHGYEPVSLKFFTLTDDGAIEYLTPSKIEALRPKKAKKKRASWVDTDFSVAFTNMELSFRKAGDPKAPVIVHRHFAANLANNAFPGSPLEKHLRAKGKVSAMTKAASYLIWNSYFSGIRDYLLANMAWMASDSTGIPPRFARKAGFTQKTFGTFKGAFLDEADPRTSDQMVELWASQPRRKLPFRYGYPDAEKRVHLMITEPTR